MNKQNLFRKIQKINNDFLGEENYEWYLDLDKINRKEHIYYNIARTLRLYKTKSSLKAKQRVLIYNFVYALWTRDTSKLHWLFRNQFQGLGLIKKFTLYGIVRFIKDGIYIRDPFQHGNENEPMKFSVDEFDGFIEITNNQNEEKIIVKLFKNNNDERN